MTLPIDQTLEQTEEMTMLQKAVFLEELIETMESIDTIAAMQYAYKIESERETCSVKRRVLKHLARVAGARIDELYAGAAI